ncbi:hypothetical protein QYE76_065679 [Lolium multiflorum]|uniref:Uncharacterized protein n=1 Tax=Lolium multiflorum TaxID=4521 RepID=A0AAD8S9V0_LOLMU|nr:hypothetical protein QYE76_065679 [Lolium multiflorum]
MCTKGIFEKFRHGISNMPLVHMPYIWHIRKFRLGKISLQASVPAHAHPPTFEYRDPDASDDDDGDYDDYSGDYYRARHEYD